MVFAVFPALGPIWGSTGGALGVSVDIVGIPWGFPGRSRRIPGRPLGPGGPRGAPVGPRVPGGSLGLSVGGPGRSVKKQMVSQRFQMRPGPPKDAPEDTLGTPQGPTGAPLGPPGPPRRSPATLLGCPGQPQGALRDAQGPPEELPGSAQGPPEDPL